MTKGSTNDPTVNHPTKPIGLGTRIWRATVVGSNALLAIALIAAGVFFLDERAQGVAPVAALDPLTVQTQIAQLKTGYEVERRFAGRIEAARQASLATELGGTVTRIVVNEGQRVAKGDVIARLDTRSLRATRAQQIARRQAAEKDRELAQLDAKRQLELKRKGFTSGQAWDAARLRVEGLDSNLAQIDGALRAIRVNLSKSVVLAPFDGVVGARLVDEGSTLAPGAALITLFEKARPQARVGLPPKAAARLKENATYRLDVQGQSVQASLVQLRPDLNNTTRTVTAIFEFDAARLPRFGQIAQLVLTEKRDENGFWVPLSALKEGERGLWDIMILHEQNGELRVVSESVEVMHADGARAYVRGTLQSGARFISDGVHRITVGQIVREQQS
jgi:RND family efflux transporter MFP subunit